MPFFHRGGARQTDMAWVAELFAATKNALLAQARAILEDEREAEDAVQTVFQRIAEAPQRLRYDAPGANRAYLLVMVRNLALDRRRQRLRQPEPPEEDDPAPHPGPEEALLAKECSALAQRLLQELPEKYRDAIFLKITMDCDDQELAQTLGVSYAAARQRLSRGLRLLREQMRKEGYDHD